MSELLKINVNEHVEKKNNLSYLSWAWAWAEVLKIDPLASWYAQDYCGRPVCVLEDGSAMVGVTVVIKGHGKSCLLPVMDHRNKAIKNPDAFAINTAIMRCLAKAIAMHGLGLYIYAGEDLPEGEDEKEPRRKENGILEGVGVHKPTDGIIETMDAEERAYIQRIAASSAMVEQQNGIKELVNRLERSLEGNDQWVAFWSLLGNNSKLRNAIKKEQAERRQAKQGATA